MLRKLKTLALLAVIAVGVAACDDNPLSEDRNKVDRFQLNPSFANVLVGGTTQVTAIPVNRHGEPTGDAVTGTACDAKISIDSDSTRTAFEPPERWIVTGVSAGESCVNVSSGGVSATITVNVVS
jgi:hypothetical protein